MSGTFKPYGAGAQFNPMGASRRERSYPQLGQTLGVGLLIEQAARDAAAERATETTQQAQVGELQMPDPMSLADPKNGVL